MKQETGNMKQEAGGRKQKEGRLNLEAGSWRLENLASSFKPLASYFLLLASCLLLLSACARKHVSSSAEAPAKGAHRGDNYKIGVILPLTGKYAIYGESALHGIECAVGIFSPCEGPIRAELVIKDDGGMPDRASLAVEELIQNDKVSVIIGPLSSSSIEASAQKAQALGVPLISLSQREGISKIGDYIFSVALTAASQVNEIVNWAANTKKLKKFAVTYPMNTYGQIYKQLFTEAVNKTHAKIVLAEGYGEATLDFGSIFRKGTVKFDALFIPDSYRAVGYLSSALLVEGVEDVQLLGINRWNNKELVERGGDTLQGAVFVDGFFDESKATTVRKFVSTFKEAYKIAPTILEAIGFDAARLVSKALQMTGGAHALDVKNALATLPEVEGSTGQIGFDSSREVIRRIFLLTVKGEDIVELEGHANPSPHRDKYGAPSPPSIQY